MNPVAHLHLRRSHLGKHSTSFNFNNGGTFASDKTGQPNVKLTLIASYVPLENFDGNPDHGIFMTIKGFDSNGLKSTSIVPEYTFWLPINDKVVLTHNQYACGILDQSNITVHLVDASNRVYDVDWMVELRVEKI